MSADDIQSVVAELIRRRFPLVDRQLRENVEFFPDQLSCAIYFIFIVYDYPEGSLICDIVESLIAFVGIEIFAAELLWFFYPRLNGLKTKICISHAVFNQTLRANAKSLQGFLLGVEIIKNFFDRFASFRLFNWFHRAPS